MKQLILLIAISLLVCSNSYAEKRLVENMPITLSPQMTIHEAQLAVPATHEAVSSIEVKKQDLQKFFLQGEPVENESVAFSTRYHPYPEDNSVDTARIIYNVNDPNNRDDFYYIGDTQMPINVVDQTGNSVFKLNGYFQMLPSVSWIYPQLKSGDFTIDSVIFSLHSYPSSPIKNAFLFSILNANDFNMPHFGAADYNPGTFDIDYNIDVYDKLTNAITLDPAYINSRIYEENGGYYTKKSVLDLSEYADMNSYKNDDRIMILITKDDLNDLSDIVNMIGAWEWTAPYQKCYAGTIRHYGEQNDSCSFLSATIAPRKPSTSSPDYNTWLAMYPAFMAEQTVRKNYRFIVYGRYTGEYDPNTVSELDNSADAFSLSQNSPNPAANNTKIAFAINEPSFVTLKVYNQMGQEVASLVNEYLNIGTYQSNFETMSLPAGTYFYTLSTGKYSKSYTMMIVK